jgi:hypothetical protein
MAYPQPANVAPWYLRNITQALELDEATGNVFIRTNAAIIGNVSVGNVAIGALGNVDLSGNTLPVTIDSGNVTVFQGTSPWVISGNINVDAITGNIAGITGNIGGITGNVTIVDGGGSITVDGNVGITGGNVNVAITSGNVGLTGNLAGITGNVTIVDGGGSITVDGTVNATITGGNVSTTIGGTNLDAFGRLRISEPYTLFDSQNMYINGGQFSNVTANSGSVTYVADESSFNLSVTSANGSSVISQARFTQAYQPGKSLLSMNSFCFADRAAGCRQRVGYFTDNNGIYFEADGEDLYLVIRSRASGTIQEERIAQTAWNGDTLKTGAAPNPSGINLNPELTQIFWCDIEWLGVGNVRAGFIINGEFIVCHTFQHANQAGNTTVYMTSATLNPRYEITNTAATAGARTMKQICSTVISEGGFTPSTKVQYVTNNTNLTRISSANTLTALCSIRLNPAYPDAVVLPSQIGILLVDVRYGEFQLVQGANIGNVTWSNVPNSVVQTVKTSNVITDGTVVYQGLSSSRDEAVIGEDVAKRLQLARHANGTPETLTLCVAYTQTNGDLLYKFGWQELTN